MKLAKHDRWVNVKSGVTYIVEDVVVDATNATADRLMVLYKREHSTVRFVRDMAEFQVKFRPECQPKKVSWWHYLFPVPANC